MYEFHPYFTNDGSVGLYSPVFNDIYHSADGALTEAYEKFIMPVNFDILLKNDSIKILDICYGIGYNTKSFLNFIFENYFLKINNKKYSHAVEHIAQIHTDNICNKIINNSDKVSKENNIYNGEIYTDNNLPEIYIKAVDNDKILSFLSPFIKTGKIYFNNKNLDFEYKNIDKFLKSKKKNKRKKIRPIINFLILENLINNNPEILENNDIYKILTEKKYKDFFEPEISSLFKFYVNFIYKYNYEAASPLNLHNIYYRYISNRYKNSLKHYNLENIKFELKNGDARKILLKDKNEYNLIFLDAFTPAKCPCLWSLEFFKELFKHLSHDGMILTYSKSASIRSAMIQAGFYIGEIYSEGNNKSEGTLAVKNKELIKYELSEFNLGLLKTKAGIFYRDKKLTGQNEAIIAARKLEVKNSNLISCSKYIKEYKKLSEVI